jgi:hypothetical protein
MALVRIIATVQPASEDGGRDELGLAARLLEWVEVLDSVVDVDIDMDTASDGLDAGEEPLCIVRPEVQPLVRSPMARTMPATDRRLNLCAGRFRT